MSSGYLLNDGLVLVDGEQSSTVAVREDGIESSRSFVSYVGLNVLLTYPEHNNLYLAPINPGDGSVLTPNFHRESLFGLLDDDEADDDR